MVPAARAIAFYLPQFFPIPENDQWWGKGFTEWTNVAKARPLYPNHWQPHIPADLGFYDLRLEETREAQALLARQAGIEAFCYWHYWFGHGRRILERPFAEVLKSSRPDFPFCLAWANQSWTGIWHGNPGSMLMQQEYPGLDDFTAHYRLAAEAFADERYLRVDGKPFFAVFAPHDLPNAKQFTDHWRDLAVRDGFPGIYFVAISNIYSDNVNRYESSLLDAFDAVTPLTPHDYLETRGLQLQRSARWRLKDRNFGTRINAVTGSRLKRPNRFSYADVVRHAFEDMPQGERFLPCVLPNWDNTPRSGNRGVVFEGSTPELFAEYLEKACRIVANRPEAQRIVFIKAWNEWAEGNYLEPDTRFGHGYLDAARQVLMRQA